MHRIIWCLVCLPLFAFAKEKPVIVLDPGHGGKDQGAKVRTIEEKILTLRTAYLTKRHLEDLGFRVRTTRGGRAKTATPGRQAGLPSLDEACVHSNPTE